MAERKRAWDMRKKRARIHPGPATSGGLADDDLSSVARLEEQLEELQDRFDRLFAPVENKFLYDMRMPGEKERLGVDLWSGKLAGSIGDLRAANPELVALLRAKMSNTSRATEHARAAEERHLDGILADISRGQNMHKIPLLTAATSLLGEANKTSREYHDAIATYHLGAACSEKWVDDFLKMANALRPPPPWQTLHGVAVCCFDNLSMNIDYKSYSSDGETGRQFNMTNWFYTRVPRYLASPTFDAHQLCMCSPSALSLYLAPPPCP